MTNRADAERAELTASRFIAQRETGPWSDADATALQSWLTEATLHRVVYYRLNAAWQEAGRLSALKLPDGSVPTQDRAVVGAVARPRTFAIAACVLLTCLIGSVWYLWPVTDRYATAVGGVQTVPLADGSRLTLNTDTRVRVSLSQNERHIDLDKGEAFFEVAHDAKRPFVVYAGSKRVVAVGTQFTVRRQDNDIQVAVTQGTVRYEDPLLTTGQGTDIRPSPGSSSTPSTVLLPAGSLAQSEAGSVLVKTEPVLQIEQTLSWRTGLLTFRETPLSDAVVEFNRYNTRKLVIGDPKVGTLQIGGIFGATKLDAFVHLLEGGFPIQATQEGDTIVLRTK